MDDRCEDALVHLMHLKRAVDRCTLLQGASRHSDLLRRDFLDGFAMVRAVCRGPQFEFMDSAPVDGKELRRTYRQLCRTHVPQIRRELSWGNWIMFYLVNPMF